jgi:prepilin-type N-terminal cleavage/methylation domain-containing protein
MNAISHKKGFTLTEIIVVLIIIAILSAIALPNVFRNIQKSKSYQAMNQLDWIKTAFEACLAKNGSVTPPGGACTMAALNLPTTIQNGWTYSIVLSPGQAQSAVLGLAVTPSGSFLSSDLTYSIDATDGTNSIDLTRSTSGYWSCSLGTQSPYTGVC